MTRQRFLRVPGGGNASSKPRGCRLRHPGLPDDWDPGGLIVVSWLDLTIRQLEGIDTMKRTSLICGGSGGIRPTTARVRRERGYALHVAGRDEGRVVFVPQVGCTPVLFSWYRASGFRASVGMAKGPVEGLTASPAAEPDANISVNAIASSLTHTPLARRILAKEESAASLTGLQPLQRLGETGDKAGLAAFPVSSEGGWSAGQGVTTGGGRPTLRIKR